MKASGKKIAVLNQTIEQRDEEIRELTSQIESLTKDFTGRLEVS